MVKLNRIGDGFLFEGINSQGNKILLDNTSEPGAKGVSPMESILMAVAACSGIDIITILKKQHQEITSFSAEIEGEKGRVDEANVFKNINVKFMLEGNILPEKAKKAAQLSFDKYCSVSKTLEPNVRVSFSISVNNIAV